VEQDEVAAVLARPIAQGLLGSDVPARLASTGRDGDPRLVPVAFWWDGARITVCTVPGSAKVAAIRERPRVALTVDTTGHPPHVLLVRGAADVEAVEGVPDEYVAASRKLVPRTGSRPGRRACAPCTSGWCASRSPPTTPCCWTSPPHVPRAVAALVAAASR
jgi:hypothetical protein